MNQPVNGGDLAASARITVASPTAGTSRKRVYVRRHKVRMVRAVAGCLLGVHPLMLVSVSGEPLIARGVGGGEDKVN